MDYMSFEYTVISTLELKSDNSNTKIICFIYGIECSLIVRSTGGNNKSHLRRSKILCFSASVVPHHTTVATFQTLNIRLSRVLYRYRIIEQCTGR